jgi:acetyl/propionyl-CoA carboxylase alpha subunit
MLAKIISYAPTRLEAIDILADGLDEYVIEGVQHNARLVNAVLRHPSFRAGDTPTSFLPRHIPKFTGVQLADGEEEELAVSVALISGAREALLQQPPPSAAPAAAPRPVVVRLGGMFGSKAYSVTMADDGTTRATVRRLATTDPESGEAVSSEGVGRVVAVDALTYDPTRCLARVSLDGDDRAIQVHKPLLFFEPFVVLFFV